MDLPINPKEPLTMHIDLNSCFATIEQQANPLLRNKPIGVAANLSPGGCIISPSYEAKYLGIKAGYRVRDAQVIYPSIIILPPDPDKYFFVHSRFMKIFRDYSPNVTPLSIDEAVIDFSGTIALHHKNIIEIGYEIKQRIKREIGEWITCNIGIGNNRFLAKLAASLHKPNGLDVITANNLKYIYKSIGLLDLCGINTRFEARLKSNGIYTPLQFLEAPLFKLWKQVFQSIVGYHWYVRLRGYEVDNIQLNRNSYGQSYALYHFTNDTKELARLMMKLCEKMGRRLRRANKYATGIHVYCAFKQASHWHMGRKIKVRLYSTNDLYRQAMCLLEKRPKEPLITHLAVSCYDLFPVKSITLPLFDTSEIKQFRLANTLDQINNRFGEYVIAPARMLNMENEIIKRVPFNATRDTLTELYESNESRA